MVSTNGMGDVPRLEALNAARGRPVVALAASVTFALVLASLPLFPAAAGSVSESQALSAGPALHPDLLPKPALVAIHEPPYVPDANYMAELSESIRLASETIRRTSPGILVTTNFGSYPFNDRAILGGRRFFEALPDLDLVSINLYPNDNSRVITALPRIVHEFQALDRPVVISEVGVCTEHFSPHYQDYYLRTFVLFLRLASPANIFVYELQDDLGQSGADVCEARFGLRTAEGSPRPAYDSFIEALHLDGTIGVVTHLYTSGASNLDLAAFKANLDDLAEEGLQYLSLAPAWWEMVHARGAEAVWDEERFQVLVEALEYAGNLGVAVRLHTAPPWREGMTKVEYRAVLEAYYERVASLPNLHTVQLFNEPNLLRFTDYGPLPRGARP